jgi:4-amino-4-deoxy-L-arabinose transferase-like glycosyltransferase
VRPAPISRAIRNNAPALAVAAAYVVSAFVVPTFAPVAIWDDWVYIRAAETFAEQSRLEVLEPTAATAVFQIAWGGLFGKLFGSSFGSFRLSVITLVFASGWALYLLARDLGVSAGKAALGMAVYLFNPLMYVLTFSFMTDAPFTALLAISAFAYIRGIGDRSREGWLLAGSVFAALAFLVRHQGLLIPVAVGSALLIARRLKFEPRTLKVAGLVAALPALALAGYVWWLQVGAGVPPAQQLFLSQASGAGGPEILRKWWDTAFVAVTYTGLAVAPVVLGVIRFIPSLFRLHWKRWILVLVGFVLLFGFGWTFLRMGVQFPYSPSWFNLTGLGPEDLLASRDWVLEGRVMPILERVGVGAIVLSLLALARSPGKISARAWIVISILLWQWLGIAPPSVHFGGTLDRYLLPLFPLAIVLVLWATRDVKVTWIPALAATTVLILFSIASTRDFLIFQSKAWAVASRANLAGIPNHKMFTAAGRDGYYLWKYSREIKAWDRHATGIPPGYPWWVPHWGLETDGTYVVSAQHMAEHEVVLRESYPQWLQSRDNYMYLLRKPELP